MALLEIGRKAPNFTLRDQHGHTHTLKDYVGRVVVLYFYPEDDTDLCTTQACQFRDHRPEFSKIKATVLGISPDTAESHRIFAEKHALDFPILVDEPRKGVPTTCDAYGVWQDKTMFGRRVKGLVRTTYLIDENGCVARRWDRVRVKGHAASVLAATKMVRRGERMLDVNAEIKPLPRRSPARKTGRKGDRRPPYSPVRGSVRSSKSGRGKGGKAAARLRSTGAPRKTASVSGSRGRRGAP